MIEVLVVDDSRTALSKLARDIALAPDLHVCGLAGSGEEGVRLVLERGPDVVLMDLVMPGLDGCDATRRIMTERPTPVIVTTSYDGHEATNRVFESGAVELLAKGCSPEVLHDAIRTMARVKLVGFRVRERRIPFAGTSIADLRKKARTISPPIKTERPRGIVAIGASTGGPQAVQRILANVAVDLPIAYAVALHISRGFVPPLCSWLSTASQLVIKIAEHGQRMLPRTVYFAPDDTHLAIAEGGTLALDRTPGRLGLFPSIDVLFASVARHARTRALGVLLTGMGSDGAVGLLAMRNAGAMTVTQDEASCVVYGMPRAAVELGASQAAFDPRAIAGAIAVWAHQLPKTPVG